MATRKKWHSFPADKVITILGTDSALGLDCIRLEKLQARHGLNELPKHNGFRLFTTIIKQLKSPLSLVLIIAGVGTLFLREYLDMVVILSAVSINVIIGVLQEGKAARVFEALEKSQDKNATVIRNGKQQVVSAKSLVPGDIIVLQGGTSVPADIRLLEVNNLSMNESALTGEWLPVAKIDSSQGRALPIAEQKNMAWMGTLVAEGSGKGVVVATGADARFGQITKSTQEEASVMTPLQKSIRRIARFLIGIIGVALLVILALGLFRGEPLTDMLLLAITVAVAAMPSGLPAAVTVVLAISMEAILSKGGLVKNLLATETLGSTTVILTDKTGTLTQGRMVMSGLYTAQSAESGDISAVLDNKELLKMSVLSSDAFVEEDPKETGKLTVHGRPIEKAIIESGLESGLSQADLFLNGFERLDFVQFESSRRYAISLNNCPQRGNRLYISGSPEHLLARSDRYFLNGRERKLDAKTRKMFADTQSRVSAEGMRFTAVAYVKVTGESVPKGVIEAHGKEQFVFVGLLAFADAIRADVPTAIKESKGAGVRVIMATGDYPETARAIAREVGIDRREHAPVLTGVMIDDMDDTELLTALSSYNIVARVLPKQKLRVARLLRNSGEVVAMTGDGVNDAPALAAADIGIAVGSGTEVAKAAADLILINNSFSVITAAIAEGRRVVANLRKIVTYLLSTSFGEIIIIGGALVAGAPLPLLPSQILWTNIVSESFMSFPFAFEPGEKGVMKDRPEKRGAKSILNTHVKWFIFVVSSVTGVLLLGLFFLLLWGEVPLEKIRTIMFVALSISSMFYAFSFKDLSQPIWRIPIFSNKYLLAALAASFAFLIAALTFDPLQKLLSLTDIALPGIFALVLLGLVNLGVVEVAKMLLRKRIKT